MSVGAGVELAPAEGFQLEEVVQDRVLRIEAGDQIIRLGAAAEVVEHHLEEPKRQQQFFRVEHREDPPPEALGVEGEQRRFHQMPALPAQAVQLLVIDLIHRQLERGVLDHGECGQQLRAAPQGDERGCGRQRVVERELEPLGVGRDVAALEIFVIHQPQRRLQLLTALHEAELHGLQERRHRFPQAP